MASFPSLAGAPAAFRDAALLDALGALAICVPVHGTARLEIAGQAPRIGEILAVPAYLPHTITSESREILGLLIEPESVCDEDLAEIIRQCNDPVAAGLLADPTRAAWVIDLPGQTIRTGSGETLAFEVEPLRRSMLIEGLDEIATTLRHAASIETWQQGDRRRRPWAWPAAG